MPDGRARIALGFDFGLKRIGIASGDTVSGTAAPRAIVRVTARGVDWDAIERVLRDFQPDLLVVGSPLHADGSASPRSAASDHFAVELGRRAGLAVHRADEYASSIEASHALARSRAQGVRRRRVLRGDIDSAAAAIILERWLKREGRLEEDHD